MNGHDHDLPRWAPRNGHAGSDGRVNGRETSGTFGDSTRETAAAVTGSRPVVVKLGGRALEAPGALREFASALAGLSRVTLLVHGGGAEVTSWCARLGIEARFADGLRVTDAPTLDVVTAVLAGLANKRLVAALRSLGVDAVGLAALDGGVVRARAHANAATLGAVGEVDAVDPALLATLLAQKRTPVLASIAADASGALLNLNADDAACAVAAAVGASDLVLLSDTPGLKLGGAVVPALDARELGATLANPEVAGGMRPKLRAAGDALARGVGRVHIAAWSGPGTLASLLDHASGGTTLVATPSNATLTSEDAHA